MRILLINKFLYPKGGDAISTLATGRLLSQKGHEVYYWGMKHPQNPDYRYKEYFISFVDFNVKTGLLQKLKYSLNMLYSLAAKKNVAKLLKEVEPDIVHLNNFAHQISPSILDVIRKYNIPSVMTMHDYKLVCPTYSMLLNQKPCEQCKNGRYYYCLLYKCTKRSYFKSFLNMIEMYLHHKILNIYDKIDIFISPSMFMQNKLKEMGFKDKVAYLPNFVDLDKYQPAYKWKDESIVYAGRLSYEKGISTLIDAVKEVNIKLNIIGDGPLKDFLLSKIKAERLNNINLLGYKKDAELQHEIKKSMFVVLPSECYENNPRTVLESFALGKPVVGARIGGIPELVREGITGITFKAANTQDLSWTIKNLLTDHNKIIEMGRNARHFVESDFNKEKHYHTLMQIYQEAIEKRKWKQP